MASKYARLKGQIPEEQAPPSDRQVALGKAIEERQQKGLSELTAEFNLLDLQKDNLAAQVSAVNLQLDAIEQLIRDRMDEDGADNMSINGFTWTPKVEPYPAPENASALVDYFIEKGMKDLLSIHPSRLKSMIKEEAMQNTLVITKRLVSGPEGDHEVTEVRSSTLPGVRVFLKPTLSRVKSSRGGA